MIEEPHWIPICLYLYCILRESWWIFLWYFVDHGLEEWCMLCSKTFGRQMRSPLPLWRRVDTRLVCPHVLSVFLLLEWTWTYISFILLLEQKLECFLANIFFTISLCLSWERICTVCKSINCWIALQKDFHLKVHLLRILFSLNFRIDHYLVELF